MGENNPQDERTSDARIGRRAFLQAGVATVGGIAFGGRAVVAQESGSGDAQCALGPFRQASAAFPTSTEEVADAETASDRSIRVAGRKPSTRLTPLAQGSPAWDALRGDSAGTESPAPGGSSGSARAQASVAASASTTATAEGRELAVGTEYEGFDYRSQLRETPEGPRAPIPPDPQIATGPDYHVVAVNWMWGIFEKRSGKLVYSAFLSDWFENAVFRDEPVVAFPRIFDPWVRYDPLAGRFYLLASYYNEEVNRGYWLVSVSDDDDPRGGWTNYPVLPVDFEGLVDYPKLGFGSDAVYLTQNFFAPSEAGDFAFQENTLAILNKSDLLEGDAVTSHHFRGMQRPSDELAVDFTVQPTEYPGTREPSTDSYYLVNSRYGLNSTAEAETLTLWEVTDPVDDPTLSCSAVDVTPYSIPPSAEQPEVNAPLSTIDHRLMNAVTDPSDGTVWTTHAISVDWNTDGDLIAAVRWYQIDPARNEVIQSGLLGEPGTAHFMPTVQANGESMMLVYNVSGPDTYPGVGVAGRTNGYEQGRLEDSEIVREGESPYVPYQPLAPVEGAEGEFRPPEMRYGDYSGIAVDPETNCYWSTAEYSPAYESDPDDEPIGRFDDVWSTWIAETYFEGSSN